MLPNAVCLGSGEKGFHSQVPGSLTTLDGRSLGNSAAFFCWTYVAVLGYRNNCGNPVFASTVFNVDAFKPKRAPPF